jgi:hypothetical protein
LPLAHGELQRMALLQAVVESRYQRMRGGGQAADAPVPISACRVHVVPVLCGQPTPVSGAIRFPNSSVASPARAHEEARRIPVPVLDPAVMCGWLVP